jgi:hypothetical protein
MRQAGNVYQKKGKTWKEGKKLKNEKKGKKKRKLV